MGLAEKFPSAVNENDVVHRQGELSLRNMKTTFSSAMDIQIPYNIESVFYYLSEQTPDIVKTVMNDFESGTSTTIPPEILNNFHFHNVWKEHAYFTYTRLLVCKPSPSNQQSHYGTAKIRSSLLLLLQQQQPQSIVHPLTSTMWPVCPTLPLVITWLTPC